MKAFVVSIIYIIIGIMCGRAVVNDNLIMLMLYSTTGFIMLIKLLNTEENND